MKNLLGDMVQKVVLMRFYLNLRKYLSVLMCYVKSQMLNYRCTMITTIKNVKDRCTQLFKHLCWSVLQSAGLLYEKMRFPV